MKPSPGRDRAAIRSGIAIALLILSSGCFAAGAGVSPPVGSVLLVDSPGDRASLEAGDVRIFTYVLENMENVSLVVQPTVIADAAKPAEPSADWTVMDVVLSTAGAERIRFPLASETASGSRPHESSATAAPPEVDPTLRARSISFEFNDDAFTLAPRAVATFPVLVRVPDDAPADWRVDLSVTFDLPEQGTRIETPVLALLSSAKANAEDSGRLRAPGGMTAPAPELPLLAWSAAAIGAGLAAALFIKSREEDWRAFLLSGLLGLYTRLDRALVLRQRNRARIHALILANPGIRHHALLEKSGCAPGVLMHHLAVLEQHEFVRSRRDGRMRRYFTTDSREATCPAPLTEVQERVLCLVVDEGLPQRVIAERLGMTQQGVSYHIRELLRRGVLVKRTKDPGLARADGTG